ncbi:MAG TPA: branched-chain amino acid ABC transporter ATP-binding protein/permease [Acidimicrobiales bacterium]|nr:branched-chain amino acid ABC transporter ATP-binding protein/permease [Acidimicrobiales bacterium]
MTASERPLGIWSRRPRFELSRQQQRIGLAALAVLAVVAPPFLTNYRQSQLFFPVAVYVLLAIGLNVVVGAAGMLDLGYVAFYAVGAYTTAVLTTTFHLDAWAAIPFAVVAAMLAGVLLGAPTLRLRGDYLAIVTLGFGEIVRIIALNTNALGEARGITDIKHPEPFGLRTLPYYYVALAAIALALTVSIRLNNSRVGRSWSAIREDEEAAEVMGVPTFKMRLWAFTVGASTAGLAGWLYASKVGFINPDNFPFFFSVIILSAVVLGGSGSLLGVVAGGFLIAFLPEYLRDAALGKQITSVANRVFGFHAGDVTDLRVWLFGLSLILVMIFRPRGLIPSRLGGMATTDAPTDEEGETADPGLTGNRSTPAGGVCLSIENLTVDFGGVRALDSVSISVATGSIVGVIGPNGAGKTTLFNAITGVVEPTSGDIRLDAASLKGKKPHAICQAGVARTFQNIRLFPDLSARTNVAVGLDAHHKTSVPGALGFGRRRRTEEREAKARAEALLDFVGLRGRGDARAGSLPYGDQRRLEIARALATDPCLLLLDEPGAGMNKTEKAALVALVRRIRDAGLTVVLIEHDMNLVMGLVEDITVIDFGKVIAHGSPTEVQTNQAVVDAYLGVDDGAA